MPGKIGTTAKSRAGSAVIRGSAISAMVADVARNMAEVDPKHVVTAITF
jgi:hypothetical protein